MPQLGDDLPRRDARVRRRARDEQLAAGAARQLLQPGDIERRRLVGPRVVDRRHHRDDVDRHIDPAGDRRHLLGRAPAVRVDAVGDHDQRGALRQPAAGRGPARQRRPPRRQSRHRARSARRAGSTCPSAASSAAVSDVKSAHAIEPRIERKERRFIVSAERAEQVPGGFARVDRLLPDPHAAARVDQQPELHRTVRLGCGSRGSASGRAFRDDEIFAAPGRETNRPFRSLHDRVTDTTSTDDLNFGGVPALLALSAYDGSATIAAAEMMSHGAVMLPIVQGACHPRKLLNLNIWPSLDRDRSLVVGLTENECK